MTDGERMKAPDPADKAADGAFGGKPSGAHRGGSGAQAQRLIVQTARNGGTLAAGEGAWLVSVIDQARVVAERCREQIANRGDWFGVMLVDDVIAELAAIDPAHGLTTGGDA